MLLHFTLVPIAMGRLITYKSIKDTKGGMAATYLIGLFASFAFFYVFCSFFVAIQYWSTIKEVITGCFTALCVAYSVAVAIILLLWLIMDLPKLKSLKSRLGRFVSEKIEEVKLNKFILIYLGIFTVILIGQLYIAFAYEINEWSYDDFDYVVTSHDTLVSDTISYVSQISGQMPYLQDKRVITSWPIYIAYLARVSGFEVATICHTLLPAILLMVAYGVFGYIANFLFKSDEDRLVFLILVEALITFGFYSHYSIVFRLLGTIWQGKAVLSAIVIPFFVIYLFDCYAKEISNTRLLPIIAISLGACSLSSMAILMVSVATVSVWICSCIYHKRIYAIRYLLASFVGVLFILILYAYFLMLEHDMSGQSEFKFFKNRNTENWWYKWLT